MTQHVITKDMQSELMLYHTKEDSVHVLNPTARRVYELFKEGKSPIEMEEFIRDEFSVEHTWDVVTDIQKCLKELRDRGLIEING